MGGREKEGESRGERERQEGKLVLAPTDFNDEHFSSQDCQRHGLVKYKYWIWE